MKKVISFLLIFSIVLFLIPQVVYANSPGPNLDGTYESNPAGVFVIITLYLIIIAFTCFVEWLVCITFKLHYAYTKTILVTNLITQVIMHCLEWLLMAVIPTNAIDMIAWYALTVAVLEVAVVISEYCIYRKRILALSKGSCFFYVLSANMASAFGGILLLLIIIL